MDVLKVKAHESSLTYKITFFEYFEKLGDGLLRKQHTVIERFRLKLRKTFSKTLTYIHQEFTQKSLGDCSYRFQSKISSILPMIDSLVTLLTETVKKFYNPVNKSIQEVDGVFYEYF